MDTQQLLLIGVLGFALIMFARSRWRHDLVAMAVLMFSVILGLVPADQAFVGFGHPAVVTVAAVLIISQALNNAGVVALVSQQLRRLPMSPILLLLALTSLVTFFSAFMNNVGALALMMPVTIVAARDYHVSPSMMLMPLAFGSLLGGMVTLIGTPPNIIVSTYREQALGSTFTMFDFTPVGLSIAVVGVLFLVFVGWRFIPKARLSSNIDKASFQIDHYLTELYVAQGSNLCGKAVKDLALFAEGRLSLVGVATPDTYARPAQHDHIMQANDILLVRCDPQDMRQLLDKYDFTMMTTATKPFTDPGVHHTILLEGVVSETSLLVDQDVRFLRRRTGHALALVGLARRGEMVIKRLRRQHFRAGDVLLLQGHKDTIDQYFSMLGLWPLATRPLDLDIKRQPWAAMGIFMAAIALGVSGWVSLPIAFVLAVMLYIVTGMLRVREIYEQIDWPVIVLLGAMMPVGTAMETTGTTTALVQGLLHVFGGVSPVVMLVVVFVVTMLVSDIINNAATALIMAPIALTLAQQLQVNPDTFLMAVAIGASCAFLTPIGHQSNTLVMAPGGYQFSDYWRMGLPLEIVIVVIGVPLLLFFWPL